MRPDNQAVYKKTLGAFCVPLLSLIGFDLEIHFKTKSNEKKKLDFSMASFHHYEKIPN